MAKAIVTMRIMPEGIEVDLHKVAKEAESIIDKFTGHQMQKKIEQKPVAFGLKALEIVFAMDEKLGSPDVLEEKLSAIDGVQNAEVTGVDRALG